MPDYNRKATSGKAGQQTVNQQWWKDLFNEGILDQYLKSPEYKQFTENSQANGSNGISYDGGTVSNGRGIDTGLGGMVDFGGGLANANAGGVPGAGIGIGLASDLASGTSQNQMATNFGVNVASTAAGMMGPVGQVGSSLAGMALSDDPAGAATQMTGAAFGSALGSAAGGPVGGLVGGLAGGKLGSMAYDSYTQGYLGDNFDSRTHEGLRDSLEEGMSREQAASYAAQIDHYNNMAAQQAKPKSTAERNHDGRSNVGKSLNNASLLGDKEFTAQQNADRQPNDTPGGLLGKPGEDALDFFGMRERDTETEDDAAASFGKSLGQLAEDSMSDGGRGSANEGGRGNAPGADSAGNSAGQGQGGTSGAFA